MRTPALLQLSETECGATCVGIVLAHYGRWADPEELREACFAGRDGSTGADVVRAARRFGLEATGWRASPSHLPQLPLPAVLHWGFRHYVVLEGVKRSGYAINDPAAGRRTVGKEEFDREFTGVVLTMTPGASFERSVRRAGMLRTLWPWLRDTRAAVAFAALCGLMLAVPGLTLAAVLSVFVDEVLAGRQEGWGTAMIAAAIAIGVASAVLTWLQQHCLNRLAVRLSVVHSDRFVTHLFRLPARFFVSRFAGDLARRTGAVDSVSRRASTIVVSMAIELARSLIFLGVVIWYDPLLAVIVALLGAANAGTLRWIRRARRDENQKLQRESVLLSGLSAFALRSIDTLQATSAQDDFYARWSGQQARELTAQQKLGELGYVSGALPALFGILGSAAVIGIGGWRVTSGTLSVGLLMGLLVLTRSFLEPVGRLVSLADELALLDASMRQIEDVKRSPQDARFSAPADVAPLKVATLKVATLSGRPRLAGRIELRNVTFGFRDDRPAVIEDLSLNIEVGQRVAVVGPSASGKSTLVKLLSGEYAPWSGQILYDGVPLADIPRDVLSSSLSVVDQQILLFSGTVRDNLTLWNPATSDRHVASASKDALLHDEIMQRESSYQSEVTEGGSNFSGGQRQRMEIARALVTDPSVLILDEATSSLDALTESRIDHALRRRGCTCLIVAHRLNTIRDSDLIVVLDRGREVQRGTHDELMADADGLYGRLVHSQ
ncbi:cysteine peptidase family C39 domain-containing protein [Candidatus Poriferisodalis sp.]|uniref:cysteine peptidase family C39 domain-containing protein n=1 Tax=Candidatus Poriferisodalis sp. TaxID=3101277 RepID=UPI003B02E49D